MARLTVQPASDGHDMRGNWEVKGKGKTTSHTKKKAAENAARRRASKGDEIVLKGTDGNYQESYTYQGGRDEDNSMMDWRDEYIPDELDGSGWGSLDDSETLF